ncbi:hypothetical protein [Klebsiella quasipneumoniae]|uniref:hypothetical protein n=1 Tax=Klebsiella quasipneumoniae TaxID=1463165 RepID=UPI001F552E03|nr:hypothetical protein [Klebsiella quasipneumoniae]
MEKLIVVGEKFTDFARRHENVLTVNEFERFVWSGELAGVDKSLLVRGYSSTTSPAPSALFVSTIRIKSARSSISRISIIKTTAIISGWYINVKKRISSSPRRKNAMRITIARA